MRGHLTTRNGGGSSPRNGPATNPECLTRGNSLTNYSCVELNSGRVAVRSDTSKWPLGAFAQKLAVNSAATSIDLDTSHVAAENNEEADFLSWWNQTDPLPKRWELGKRVDCSLQFIWFFRSDVRIWPNLALSFRYYEA